MVWADTVLNVVIMILSILIGGSLIGGGIWMYFLNKKYNQFQCIIWGKDGFGQTTETTDKAGIFVDSKTKNKRFFIRKANVGLEPDNVPYIQRGNKKIVYLLRYGLKNFKYIKPVVHNPSVDLLVTEEDVNWGINAYERQKKLFGQSWLLQYLPFMALAFTSIIILIIFIYFFKEFKTLADVAVAMKEASANLASAGGGTIIK